MDSENLSHSLGNIKFASTPASSHSKQSKIPTHIGLSTPKARLLFSADKKSANGKNRIPFTPLSVSKMTSEAGDVFFAAREAARIARLQSTAEKRNKVAEVKEQWATEKEQKLIDMQMKRANELKRLQEATVRDAQMRVKNYLLKKQAEKDKKDHERELLESSIADRNHTANEIEKMKKQRRKQSVLLNHNMLRKAKENELKVESSKKQEELDYLSAKREDAIKIQEAKQLDKQRKRESMMSRGKMAVIQKEVTVELINNQQEEEKSLLEFRRVLSMHKSEYEQDNLRKSRESIANRLQIWRSQKIVEEEENQLENDTEHDLIETKRMNWIDGVESKKLEEGNKRQSLAFRLSEWRKQKQNEKKEQVIRTEAEEIEWQLQDAVVKDVQIYKESLKKRDRESLAMRLEKARKGKQLFQALVP